jgi:hypothetical protein
MEWSGASVVPAGFRSRRIRYWVLFAVESAGLLCIMVEALASTGRSCEVPSEIDRALIFSSPWPAPPS